MLSEEDFTEQLSHFIRQENEPSKDERTLREEFNCIISTYLPKNKEDVNFNPENNMECPLSELGLLRVLDKKSKTYKKIVPQKDKIHPLIALAVMLEQNNGERELKISSLLTGEGNIGRIFSLDMMTLSQILSKLETRKYLSVVRTAGLDVVILNEELCDMSNLDGFLYCVTRYYQEIKQ